MLSHYAPLLYPGLQICTLGYLITLTGQVMCLLDSSSRSATDSELTLQRGGGNLCRGLEAVVGFAAYSREPLGKLLFGQQKLKVQSVTDDAR